MQITLEDIGSGELYLKIMKAICDETEDKSVADIMCHLSPYIPQLGFKERTYVDIQKRPLDHKKEQKWFVKMDVIEFLRKGKHFDVINCSDGIEHLSSYNGKLLVNLMEQYSNKQIIFTPLGEHKIVRDNHPDSHASGWTPDYFEGWASIILPNFHPTLGVGAFFAWHCTDIKQDFKRVKQQLL